MQTITTNEIQQDIEEFNLEAVAERNRQLRQIEKDVTFSAEAFRLLNKQVNHQGIAVDDLQSQIEIASDNVEIAAVQLCHAEKRVISWRWWKAGLVGAGLAVVVTAATIIGVKASSSNPST